MRFEASDKNEHGDELEMREVKLDVSEQSRIADRNLESDNGPVPIEIKGEDSRKQRIDAVRTDLARGADFVPIPTVDTSAQKVTFERPGQKAGDKGASSGFRKKFKKYATLVMVALGIASAGELKAEDGPSASSQPKGGVWGNYFKNLEVKKAFGKNKSDGQATMINNGGRIIINHPSSTYSPSTGTLNRGGFPQGAGGPNYGGVGSGMESLDEFVKKKVPGVVISHPNSYRGADQGIEVREYSASQVHNLEVTLPSPKVEKRATSSRRTGATTTRVRSVR